MEIVELKKQVNKVWDVVLNDLILSKRLKEFNKVEEMNNYILELRKN